MNIKKYIIAILSLFLLFSCGDNKKNINLENNSKKNISENKIEKETDVIEKRDEENKNLIKEGEFSEKDFENFGAESEDKLENKEKEGEFSEKDFENFGAESEDESENKEKESSKNKEKEKLNCENHYKELLNKFSGDFSDCNFKKENIGACSGKESDTGKVNLVIVFDDSGSMGVKIGSETMIDIAKKSVNKYINKIDLNDTNLGFVLYGHKGSSGRKGKNISCYGVEEVLSLGEKNVTGLLDEINDLSANGWTPIDRSLKKAKKMINSYAKPKDKNIILLISDGKESCQGNPLETAKNISDGKNKIKIDVIGFNVKGDTKNELLKISNNGGGKYFDVKNEIEFEKTFNNVKTFLKVMECGANKASQELEQGVKAINTYYTCQYKIKEEEALIFTAMEKECKNYIKEKLEEKHSILEKDFENLKKDGEKILKNFSKHMKDIQNKIKN